MGKQEERKFIIRRPLSNEHLRQNEVIREAWKVAYAHIYTPEEIQAVFENRIPQIASWVNYRVERLGTLLADYNGQIVGTSGKARMENGDSELASLYVLPQFQGQGVGQALWQRVLDDFRAQGFKAMQVWTLARAEAVNFYLAQGCYRYAEGTYTIGNHTEPAIGFRINL